MNTFEKYNGKCSYHSVPFRFQKVLVVYWDVCATRFDNGFACLVLIGMGYSRVCRNWRGPCFYIVYRAMMKTLYSMHLKNPNDLKHNSATKQHFHYWVYLQWLKMLLNSLPSLFDFDRARLPGCSGHRESLQGWNLSHVTWYICQIYGFHL